MSTRGLALSLLLLTACKQHPTPPPHPVLVVAPPVVAPPVVAPTVVALDAGALVDVAPEAAAPTETAVAWTDPGSVDALVTSCAFHPPAAEPGDEGDPRSCDTNIEEQSCSYDPCHENIDLPCRRVCRRSCVSCDRQCRGSCSQCRASCHDAACIRTCATSCGQCLQTCITAKDSCLTAGCAQRYGECSRRSVDHFRHGACLPACTRCLETCGGRGNDSPCLVRCLGRACTSEEVNHCAWDGTNYGREEGDDGDNGEHDASVDAR